MFSNRSAISQLNGIEIQLLIINNIINHIYDSINNNIIINVNNIYNINNIFFFETLNNN